MKLQSTVRTAFATATTPGSLSRTHCSPTRVPARPEGANRPVRSAFTLIEILVAVTILSIMVLLTVRIIANATDIIGVTTRRASQNMEARVVMDMITRDFLQAVANTNYYFYWNSEGLPGVNNPLSTPTYGTYRHEGIKFVAFTGQPVFTSDGSYREAEKICYFLKDATDDQVSVRGFPFYRLMRASTSISTADNASRWSAGSIPESDQVELISYVVSLSFNCCDMNGYSITKGSETNTLPAYMDVFLAVLSEQDARRAERLGAINSIGSEQQTQFIAKNARRYYTRCFSPNRTAYSGGR